MAYTVRCFTISQQHLALRSFTNWPDAEAYCLDVSLGLYTPPVADIQLLTISENGKQIAEYELIKPELKPEPIGLSYEAALEALLIAFTPKHKASQLTKATFANWLKEFGQDGIQARLDEHIAWWSAFYAQSLPLSKYCSANMI